MAVTTLVRQRCHDCGEEAGWILVENEWGARIAICNTCWNKRDNPRVLGYVD